MREVMKKFRSRKDIHFLHATGAGNYEEFLRGFSSPENGNNTIKPYIYDMPQVLAAADLIICRAGAATLAELTATGVPAILIPYPYATGNHQEFNARFLEKAGAATVIKDTLLTGEMLANQIESLLGDPGRLESMAMASRQLGRPQALEDILEGLEELLKRR
jgi:UDP-N-acetylglucosamine--N-acetylmuramyl-(pentapeptide) pyrophosphoryl-undecaprenol N-acetylglucosamine transferase